MLISALSEAYLLTHKVLYKDVIEQTMAFVQAEWVSPEGGFYSSYDADSEGVEGKYYTWPKAEIEELLGEDAAIFCSYYGVTEEGNWEETNILWSLQPLEDFCTANHLSYEQTAAVLQKNRETLLQIRKERIKPLLDDKILMNWNALMITACCKAYMALGHPSYLQMAETAASFIEKYLKDEQGYYHHYKKRAAVPAFLDDLSFYVQSLIHLQEITADQQYLHRANACMKIIDQYFKDEASPFFFYTMDGQQDVVVRKKEWYDGAIPSGNSTMAFNLYYLGVIFDRQEWRNQSTEMVQQLSAAVVKYPTSFGNTALTLQQLIQGADEVSINGVNAGPVLKSILGYYWPNRIIQTQLQPDNQFPLFSNRWPKEEEIQIYLCKNYMCHQPVTTVEALINQRKIKELKAL